MPDLESIAAELYALPPSEFTAERNERAKSEGGPLGAAVKSLAKPSAAAWATNLLARERPDEVAQLFDLGDALRDAQEGADRSTLTKLGSQRRALVSALAKQAGALAKDAGHAVNASALTDIQSTLNAGMSDAGAAAAVASGRLVRALAGDGLDAVDLTDAVGGALPAMRATAARPAKKLDKRAVEAARKARAEAEARLREATATAEAAEKAVEEAGRVRESLVGERDELREHLADVEAELGEAGRALDEAQRARKAAVRDRDRAERSLPAPAD
jgi:hypothetical protein